MTRRKVSRLTLQEIVQEAAEKTGWPEIEVLTLVRENWPRLKEFKPTQVALLIYLIERKERDLR
jgi:hypothetical protein